MSYNRRDEDLFRYFINGLDSKMQADLSYRFAHNKLLAKEEHRREMEQMKKEIVADILANLSLTVDITDVLRQIEELRRAIEDLGR